MNEQITLPEGETLQLDDLDWPETEGEGPDLKIVLWFKNRMDPLCISGPPTDVLESIYFLLNRALTEFLHQKYQEPEWSFLYPKDYEVDWSFVPPNSLIYS